MCKLKHIVYNLEIKINLHYLFLQVKSAHGRCCKAINEKDFIKVDLLYIFIYI